MRRSIPRVAALAGLLALVGAAPAAGQDARLPPPTPPDTVVVQTDAPAAADTTDEAPSREARSDPRLTWLGDTLSVADSIRPRFSNPPEVHPDSLVDPYQPARPGGRPEWELTGDQLLGRGAFTLLDVIESEALVLGHDLGGPGLPSFLGSALGTYTNVQVVVDGVPVGDPLEAAWDLRRIAIESIARVRYWSGAQAAWFGGDGTGGVLEIVTRRAIAPTARSMLHFHLGSSDGQAFAGSFGRRIGSRGQGGAFVAANFDDSEGLARTGDFTRNQFAAKGDWRFGPVTVEVSRISDGLTGTEARADTTGVGAVVGEEDRNATLVHGFARVDVGPIQARLHGLRETHGAPLAFDLATRPGLTGESERDRFGGRLSFERAGFHAWAGADWESAEATSSHGAFARIDGTILEPPPAENPEAPSIPNPRERTEVAAGAGWGLPGALAAGNVAVRRADHDGAEATSWQVEGVARPIEGVEIRAAVGQAERPPDLVGQAILARLASEAIEIHPGLAADPAAIERWRSWSAEAAWTRPGWRVAGRAFGARGEGAFLWTPPGGWLAFDPADMAGQPIGDFPFNAFDVLDVSIDGFGADLVVPLPWYDVEGRLAYRRIDATEDLLEGQLPYVPRDQAMGQLRFADRFFPSRDLLVEARLTGRYAGERAARNGETLPRYLVADALVQATIIDFTIYVAFRNLADTIHRAEEGFVLAGREGFVGVVWRFRR